MHPPDYLLSALAHLHNHPPNHRPHVTLSYAQSLDAKIAGTNRQQLILSGNESIIMTHWIRSIHSAILIGIGTALNDNPQLNTRHLPPRDDDLPHPQPQPIILDPTLRFSPTSKLLSNFNSHTGLQPWLLCRIPDQPDRTSWQQRHDLLTQAGAFIIPLNSSQHFLPLSDVLQKLSSLGITSLMVEGGARIIHSFLTEPSLVDTVILTVAPTLVGSDGLSYSSPAGIPHFQHSHTQIVGNDAVFILKKAMT